MSSSEVPESIGVPAVLHGLAVDPNNPRAAEIVRSLSEYVDLSSLAPDLCVVAGGDGFLLSTIRERGSRTYLGINAGRLGFLLNDVGEPGR